MYPLPPPNVRGEKCSECHLGIEQCTCCYFQWPSDIMYHEKRTHCIPIIRLYDAGEHVTSANRSAIPSLNGKRSATHTRRARSSCNTSDSMMVVVVPLVHSGWMDSLHDSKKLLHPCIFDALRPQMCRMHEATMESTSSRVHVFSAIIL